MIGGALSTEASRLPAAYLPYAPAFAGSQRWPAAFLILSCAFSIFTNFLSVTLAAVAWPALYLAFACGVSRHRFIWLGLLPLSAFSAVGAADYFKLGMTGGTSWALVFAIVLIFNLSLGLAAWVQVRLWRAFPRWATACLAFPTVWTGCWQLVYSFSPIGAAGNPAMGFATEPTIRQVGVRPYTK